MAFKLNGNDDDQGHIVDINVVPLVDVMLVLLIIFMVTAPLSIGGIGVELPGSRARTTAVDQERVILSITKDGEFYLDKTQIPASTIDKKLQAIFEFREKKELYIRADRGVPYGRVVDAMTAAKLAGVTRMAMLTKNEVKK